MAQSTLWTKAEEVMLCEAWLAATKHPIYGSYTSSHGFWTEVKHLLGETFGPRNLNAIKYRFQLIELAVKDFNYCSCFAQLHRKSTDTDEDVLKTALGIYVDRHRTLYTHTHCWEVLKSHPEFIRTEAIPADLTDHIEEDEELELFGINDPVVDVERQERRPSDSTADDATTETPTTTHEPVEESLTVVSVANNEQATSQQDQEHGATDANPDPLIPTAPDAIGAEQATDQAQEQNLGISTVSRSSDAEQATAQQAQEPRGPNIVVEQSRKDPASLLVVINVENRVDQGKVSAVAEEALPAQVVPASTCQDPEPRAVDMDVSATVQVSAAEAVSRLIDDGLGENISTQQAPRKREKSSEGQSSGKKPRRRSTRQPQQVNVFDYWPGMEASRAAIKKQELLLEMNLHQVQVLRVTLQAMNSQAKAKENRIKNAKEKALARKGLRDVGMPEGDINLVFPL
ncbi:hypothetical protein Poli38472_010824 [Pythium oligandrum]|uniref:Myb-like domain-containing protein n=1 Tax=Pythium oligandrum TaxID=41045 RepID=A0A8K1CE53_PYTOL|nr:hypothetical protein Poli38472_010824 [Pythium oligandrum]|eukprot:TMW61761.1 hypothetical protein Poli38472_010824 [Pythium oligandrum]